MNHITNSPGYWRICANEYILNNSASPVDWDEVKMDLMLVNMKRKIFILISTIVLPKLLAMCYRTPWKVGCDLLCVVLK